MKQTGIIILSHYGFSFVEELCGHVKSMGLAAYVLSSSPPKEDECRRKILLEHATIVSVAESNALSLNDVNNFIDELRAQNQEPIACMTVWEGYRFFMAQINAKLRANDVSAELIELLRDKFSLRKKLNKDGLSQVNSMLLNEENFKSLQNSKKIFIKPRFGLASCGTFKLKPEDSWEKILEIQKNIALDKKYRSAFNETIEFIAEDYIDGDEYSFEIIVFNKKLYLIAIHEKIDLEETASAALESACISPPPGWDTLKIDYAKEWITKIFAALSISCGCYHVEAKCDQGQWEIIEINPRVGGALISRSVDLQIQSDYFLALWIKTLLSQNNNELLQYLESITLDNEQLLRRSAIFFRVYFADTIGKIKTIEINKIQSKPSQIQVFLKPGFNISSLHKEIFLAQALWKFDHLDANGIAHILSESRQLLKVVYE